MNLELISSENLPGLLAEISCPNPLVQYALIRKSKTTKDVLEVARGSRNLGLIYLADLPNKEDIIEIVLIAVHPSEQHTGLGRELFYEALRLARSEPKNYFYVKAAHPAIAHLVLNLPRDYKQGLTLVNERIFLFNKNQIKK